MKKKARSLYYALSVLLLTSCEYYYTDTLFQGFWQVTSIEERESGNTTCPEGELYYAFQRHMVQLSRVSPNKTIGDEPIYYLSYFTNENDSLHVGPFKIDKNEHQNAPLSELKRFGIYGQESIFGIEQTKHGMVLTSDSAIVTLRKY